MNSDYNGPDISEALERILERKKYPAGLKLKQSLQNALAVLQQEPADRRPPDDKNNPGGLVKLDAGGYFIIIPDLHARMDFFNAVLNWTGFSGRTVISDMIDGRAQVICVGDAFHSESRGRDRWQKAMHEWLTGYKHHKHMDQEMTENLGLLEMISVVKAALPDRFHFLKGNHENIANEQGGGNYPFRKFVYEGEMVKLWVEKFLGDELFDLIYRWEKSLPLMAEGPDFLVSHCEPGRAITRAEVINAYGNEDVIYSLTWVDNDRAQEGSVPETLSNFGITTEKGRIFGGHRPVEEHYALRQDGRYIQINTPNRWVFAAFTDMEIFKPERDIVCIERNNNG